jgi:alpha-galactosidase
MIVMAKLIHNNNTVFLHFIILFLSISSLSVSARRIVPFLQNYGKPIFRSNFHNIYDTSNYGLFQLTNGLALTPQMGFVSLFFSSFLSIHQNTFQFIISSCVDGTAGTSLHAISMKHLLRKQVLLFSSLVAPSPT